MARLYLMSTCTRTRVDHVTGVLEKHSFHAMSVGEVNSAETACVQEAGQRVWLDIIVLRRADRHKYSGTQTVTHPARQKRIYIQISLHLVCVCQGGNRSCFLTHIIHEYKPLHCCHPGRMSETTQHNTINKTKQRTSLYTCVQNPLVL